MAAPTGRPSSFSGPGVPLNLALVALVVVIIAAVAIGSQVRARRRAEMSKVSGGRKSLVMNLFDRA